jgi:transcription antitermination factor NusG
MPTAWYVIHSKPNKETYVASQLEAKQIEHFYPCMYVTPVNPRSRKIKPYFPGYLFLKVDLENCDTLPCVQWMPGAVGLVCFDGKAAQVPDGMISTIKQKLAVDVDHYRMEHQFSVGDRVRVLDGPFLGYEGIFNAHLSGSDRARVFIDCLRGQSIKIDLPDKFLKNIQSH